MTEFEAVTKDNLFDIAPELTALVNRGGQELRQVRPELRQRYRDNVHTIHRLRATLFVSGILASGVVRVGNETVGFGNIFEGETIADPQGGELSGRRVDYWTQLGVLAEDHAEAVRQMARYREYGGLVFAAMTNPALDRAQGIPQVMHHIGDVDRVTVLGEDRNGLSAMDGPVSIFAMEASSEAQA
jgi:hypothetical protein